MDKVQARESELYEMYNVAEDWSVCSIQLLDLLLHILSFYFPYTHSIDS